MWKGSRVVTGALWTLATCWAAGAPGRVAAADEDWRLPKPGYREILEKVDAQRERAGDLEVRLRVIPDGYVYYMALGMEELERSGLEGKKLEKELKQLHSKFKRTRGKTLFLFEFAMSGERSYCFLTTKVTGHVEVKTKKRVTMSVAEIDPKPRYETWQIFETPPGVPRKVYKLKLANVSRLRFGLYSSGVRTGSDEPLSVTLSGMLLSKFTGGIESVNERERQVSANRIEDITVKGMEFRVYPGKWKVPEPPAALAEILEKLN